MFFHFNQTSHFLVIKFKLVWSMHDHVNVEQQKRLQRWRFYPVDAEGVVNVAYHDEPMMLDKTFFSKIRTNLCWRLSYHGVIQVSTLIICKRGLRIGWRRKARQNRRAQLNTTQPRQPKQASRRKKPNMYTFMDRTCLDSKHFLLSGLWQHIRAANKRMRG